MTSVDSGVETENDSNDSLATHDSQSMDLSPSVRVNNGEVNMLENKEPVASGSSVSKEACDSCLPSTSNDPSTSSSSTSDFKDAIKDEESEDDMKKPLEFRLPALKPSTISDIEPPAGLSFLNIKQNGVVGSGYEVIGQGYAALKPKMRLKMSKRFGGGLKSCRDTVDPFTKYSERKLRRAVSTNNWDMVERLLEDGVNPNSCDELRRSPLHLAACRGYTNILQMLLQRGADPNQKDSMGNTPLHLAACTNHVSVITLLLKAGTDVHSSDHFGRSPLQLAQTRLRLLQKSAASNPDAWQVKNEVQKVIEMMLVYLNRYGGPEADAELLSSFSSRLTLTQTSQEVDQELRGLLASLSNLAIDKPGPS